MLTKPIKILLLFMAFGLPDKGHAENRFSAAFGLLFGSAKAVAPAAQLTESTTHSLLRADSRFGFLTLTKTPEGRDFAMALTGRVIQTQTEYAAFVNQLHSIGEPQLVEALLEKLTSASVEFKALLEAKNIPWDGVRQLTTTQTQEFQKVVSAHLGNSTQITDRLAAVFSKSNFGVVKPAPAANEANSATIFDDLSLPKSTLIEAAASIEQEVSIAALPKSLVTSSYKIGWLGRLKIQVVNRLRIIQIFRYTKGDIQNLLFGLGDTFTHLDVNHLRSLFSVIGSLNQYARTKLLISYLRFANLKQYYQIAAEVLTETDRYLAEGGITEYLAARRAAAERLGVEPLIIDADQKMFELMDKCRSLGGSTLNGVHNPGKIQRLTTQVHEVQTAILDLSKKIEVLTGIIETGSEKLGDRALRLLNNMINDPVPFVGNGTPGSSIYRDREITVTELLKDRGFGSSARGVVQPAKPVSNFSQASLVSFRAKLDKKILELNDLADSMDRTLLDFVSTHEQVGTFIRLREGMIGEDKIGRSITTHSILVGSAQEIEVWRASAERAYKSIASDIIWKEIRTAIMADLGSTRRFIYNMNKKAGKDGALFTESEEGKKLKEYTTGLTLVLLKRAAISTPFLAPVLKMLYPDTADTVLNAAKDATGTVATTIDDKSGTAAAKAFHDFFWHIFIKESHPPVNGTNIQGSSSPEADPYGNTTATDSQGTTSPTQNSGVVGPQSAPTSLNTTNTPSTSNSDPFNFFSTGASPTNSPKTP